MSTDMLIAVDFDGTIVEHRYPEIGKEKPFATDTLRRLIADRHRLILWTLREGKLLDEAIEWCKERGVEFYAVNSDYPGQEFDASKPIRKLKVDWVIDDRNIGGLPDWGVIYHLISRQMTYEQYLHEHLSDAPEPRPAKRPWWKR